MFARLSKLLLFFVPVAMAFAVGSCKEDGPDDPTESKIPELVIPTNYQIIKGEPRVVTLEVSSGTVLSTDILSLEREGEGVSTPCAIGNITATAFSFDFPAKFGEGGSFRINYRRGESSRTYGPMTIEIIDRPFDPDAGTTIYGTISSGDSPVAGVVVSDGFEVTVTDADGRYQLASDKRLGYVFMSVPSGYEPNRNGVFPVVHQMLKFDAETPEIVNFALTKVDQSNLQLLFLGDMHLANRTADLSQFAKFTDDLNKHCKENAGKKIYGITLGDMTWDLYWEKNKYALPNYVQTMNLSVENLMIYHTIGNHDNDMKAHNNIDAKKPFRNVVAPNYYSYNIGAVHFVVLDNIDCCDYNGENRKYYERLVAEQLQWLRKDLSYVDKATPLIITLHAPVFGINGATNFKLHMANASELLNVIKGYSVDIVSGHTHKNYNVSPDFACTGGEDVFEHNVGAVCGSWWWSGYLTTGVHLAPDGTPGGFAIWNVNGKDMDWIYKPTGSTVDYQFRTYDLNNVKFSDADVPSLDKTTAAYKDFKKYIDAYQGKQNHEVLLNVWNYNPKWKITVKQADGRELTPKQVMAYDPLHIAALSVKRFNSSSVKTSPSFITQSYPHFFKVTCSDADVDLDITVQDEFGHVWSQRMERPQAFSIEAYKQLYK